ncbi:hypothetical protein [Natronococcus wangiae]|uniref:hypothetical protein n=1 Tax=Natronococcus wangiae TaxID=3068275 RepID=UPI00273DB239|nr:hypothetical protein [Natronococcus sp. AD5]
MSRELSSDTPRLQLFGLLHDAGEAYLGDIPRPIKDRLEVIERTEARVLEAVWESFDVDPPTTDEWERVLAADDRLLAHELLEDGSWADDPPDLRYDLRSDSIAAVRDRFCTRGRTLLERID